MTEGGRHQARVQEQPGLILHSYPWRETSLIVDAFTREHGRVALVAKGAKRPHSALRGVLQTFQPLSLFWSGKAEVRTLTKAEWVGGMLPLSGQALLCGFYLNELLVKFCAREDPYESLFDHYLRTLTRLGHGEPPAPVLRTFERALLQESGYAVALDWCTKEGATVRPEQIYVFHPERGVRPQLRSDPSHWPQVRGKTLLDLTRDDYADPATAAEAKYLMRFLLNQHLQGVPLATRQILMELQQL